MIRKLCLAIVVVCFASPVRADLITIGTDAPPGIPIVTNAGAISGPMLLNVVNNIPLDAAPDLFEGWQASLIIIADAGSTGSVTFNSPTSGTASNPANYVFASTTSFGISANNSGTGLTAFDFEFPTGPGVQVPLAPGFNLLEMDFLASADALGTFGVYALGGPGQSEWTAADLTARNFFNVPNGIGGMVQIGEILVVPEPSGLLFVAIFLSGLALFPARRTRCRDSCWPSMN